MKEEKKISRCKFLSCFDFFFFLVIVNTLIEYILLITYLLA